MQFNHEFVRSEFGWIAVDAEGFIGYLSIAGRGPLPVSVLANAALFEDVFEASMKLPETCQAIPNPNAPGVTYEWEKLAKRGLFAYDWNEELKCYQIIATPRVPRRVEALCDTELARLAEMTVLPLKFRESGRIESSVVP